MRLYRPEKTLGTDILGDRDRGGLPYRKIYLRSWSVGPRSRIVRKSTRNGSRNMETEVRFALGIDSPDPSLGEGWARAMLYLGTSLFWYGESGAHFEWTWIDFLDWLSCSWSALSLEEGWPINLPKAVNPGSSWGWHGKPGRICPMTKRRGRNASFLPIWIGTICPEACRALFCLPFFSPGPETRYGWLPKRARQCITTFGSSWTRWMRWATRWQSISRARMTKGSSPYSFIGKTGTRRSSAITYGINQA